MLKKIRLSIRSLVFAVYGVFVLPVAAQNAPLFPTDVKMSAVNELLMTEKGLNRLGIYSSDGKTLLRAIAFDDAPTGVVPCGENAFVTTSGRRGSVQMVSLSAAARLSSLPVGIGACAPVLNEEANVLYVCNQFQNTVSEIDLKDFKVSRTVEVLREPRAAALSADGRYLFVNNFLPAQRADVDYVAACVSVIETATFRKVKDIRLANGSNALRGVCISPDGRYVFVSHNLGRFAVPTSQLQQGWMNTSAFSIIDAGSMDYLGTVLTDEPERGAAGVWSIACDEANLYISHSGTHEVSVIKLQPMLEKFFATPDKASLDYDLNFLYGLRERIAVRGIGPRAFLLSPGRLVIPTYFSDVLNVMDTHTLQIASTVNLNPDRQETDANKGERFFNDASHCFQGWQSCNGCHPGDARSDGMNWDLMNDGVGNPKNCKSLLFSHVTPPSMISGIRKSAEVAVWAGFKYIQFFDVSKEDAACVDAYLKSLQPVSSPYLVNGELSPKARAGKAVFERLKCDVCHSGVYFTDGKMHRIGEDIEFDAGWDTPTLREVWRTAPYLFDGRARTMKDVFLIHRHGMPEKKVSEKDIEALTEYVNSL